MPSIVKDLPAVVVVVVRRCAVQCVVRCVRWNKRNPKRISESVVSQSVRVCTCVRAQGARSTDHGAGERVGL